MTELKMNLLKQYLEFTQQMIQILDQPDFEEELFRLLDERENLISQINAIDQEVGLIVKDDAIVSLLELIQDNDLLLTEKLAGLKEEAAQQLQSIKQAQQVNNRYNDDFETYDGVFYDKKY